MHLDDERIQRLLHGGLEPPAEREARRHLESCAGCRGLLEEARAEEAWIFAVLGSVDHPSPAVDPGTLLARGELKASPRTALGSKPLARCVGTRQSSPA